MTKDSWSISEVSQLSYKHGLMFSDTLETINDKALEPLTRCTNI